MKEYKQELVEYNSTEIRKIFSRILSSLKLKQSILGCNELLLFKAKKRSLLINSVAGIVNYLS